MPSKHFEQHIVNSSLKNAVCSNDVINFQFSSKISLGIMFELKMKNKATEEGRNELLHLYFIFKMNCLEDNGFCNLPAL